MKAFVVMTIARQIDGEYVFVRGEKGFTQASAAEEHMQSLKKQFVDKTGKALPQEVSTAQGAAQCICEVGVFELEIEE